MGRLRCIARVAENHPPKKILGSEPVGMKGRDTPHLRWKNGVQEDARNWQGMEIDHQRWRRKRGSQHPPRAVALKIYQNRRS